MDPLLHRKADARPPIDVHFEHDRVAARPGDTVALTLLAAGILETSRSVKFRRPRGAYCLRGDCGSCLVRIDGQPNQRACVTTVMPHMQIDPQNRLLNEGPDPSAIVDRLLKGGMDHHHFMVRPKLVNTIMQGVARGLTGLGTLPDHEIDGESRHRVHTPDVLIIGGGPAGRGVHAVLGRAPGRSVLWLDRRPQSPNEAEDARVANTGVFGVYPDEGLVSAMTRRHDGPPTLHTIRPRHVVFATGATDPILPIASNDLPGVVSARGLLAQMHHSGAVLGCPVVVVGRGPLAASAAAALGCRVVDPDDVITILGSSRVEGVQTRTERIKASLVALAPAPSPAYELARQGGAAVRWDGAGFAVVRDADGRCHSDGPWTAWVCGDAAGYDEASHDEDPRQDPRSSGDADPTTFGRAHDAVARQDGRRIGDAVLAALHTPVPAPIAEVT